MTKVDIVERIKEKTGMNGKEAAAALEAVFGLIKQTLESGENIKLSGFGNFIVKQKQHRKGRNPQTGESMTISARKVLTFKPSTVLRSAINNSAQ